MSYQTVSSTSEDREDLLDVLGITAFMLFVAQCLGWLIMQEEEISFFSWLGVALAALAGAFVFVIIQRIIMGKTQGTQTTANFGHGLVAIKADDLWGMFSVELGEIFLPFEYNSIEVLGRCCGGAARHLLPEKNGRFGLYSVEEMRLVIPLDYTEIDKVNDDLCAVKDISGKWGIFSFKKRKDCYASYILWLYCMEQLLRFCWCKG